MAQSICGCMSSDEIYSLIGIAKHFARGLFNNRRLMHIKRLTYNKRHTLMQERGFHPTEIYFTAQASPSSTTC